jgi:hypothetical protein
MIDNYIYWETSAALAAGTDKITGDCWLITDLS